jgi:hypothetical protein
MRFRALLACLILALAAVPARAGDGIGLDYAWPGMAVGQLRFAAWPPGAKLLCGGDESLPDGLGPVARQQLALPKPMVKARMGRCGLFIEDSSGGWIPGQVALAGNPAELWAMTIVGDDGSDKVVQIYLLQRRQFFQDTETFLSARFGQPDQQNSTAARWTSAAAEAMVGPDRGGGFYVLLVDTRLQELMQTRIAGGHKR